MRREVVIVLLIALFLFLLQAGGGWFQIRDYKKAIHRVHKLGNVGVGQTKGRFLNGNLVLIACDKTGRLTGMEVMDGISLLAHFKPRDTICGRPIADTTIADWITFFATFDKKQLRRFKGYVQAIDALDLRINHPEKMENPDNVPKSDCAVTDA